MKSKLWHLPVAILAGVAIGFGAAHVPAGVAAAQGSAPIRATRLYTGPDGLAHFENVNMSVNPANNRTAAIKTGSVQFARSAPGSFVDWHPEAQRQYVIALQGQLEIGASGGETRVFGPGDILLAEDLTGKGHTSRTVGGQERISIIFPVAE